MVAGDIEKLERVFVGKKATEVRAEPTVAGATTFHLGGLYLTLDNGKIVHIRSSGINLVIEIVGEGTVRV